MSGTVKNSGRINLPLTFGPQNSAVRPGEPDDGAS